MIAWNLWQFLDTLMPLCRAAGDACGGDAAAGQALAGGNAAVVAAAGRPGPHLAHIPR